MFKVRWCTRKARTGPKIETQVSVFAIISNVSYVSEMFPLIFLWVVHECTWKVCNKIVIMTSEKAILRLNVLNLVPHAPPPLGLFSYDMKTG